MTAVALGQWPPGSPEWHAARAAGIGGSEVAPILGLSPFESRFSLWHRKAGRIAPVDVSPEMEWGTRLEPAIAQKFRETHPELAFEAGQYLTLRAQVNGQDLRRSYSICSTRSRLQQTYDEANRHFGELFKDLFAGIRDIVGGRSGAYESTLREARATALNELKEEARALGADAVIGIDLDYEVLGQGGSMLMVSASGTAVKLG